MIPFIVAAGVHVLAHMMPGSSVPSSEDAWTPLRPCRFCRPLPETKFEVSFSELEESHVLADLAALTADLGPWGAAARMFNPSTVTEGNR